MMTQFIDNVVAKLWVGGKVEVVLWKYLPFHSILHTSTEYKMKQNTRNESQLDHVKNWSSFHLKENRHILAKIK